MGAEYHEVQSALEDKVYQIYFQLLSTVTLTSVTFTHILPDGTQETGNQVTLDGVVQSPIANVAVPSGLEVGTHLVYCKAVTSDAKQAPIVLLIIYVN